MSKTHGRPADGWVSFFRQQDWALLPVFVGGLIAIGIIEHQVPVIRPVFIYDATISYAKYPDTVHFALAPAVPAIIMLFTVIILEFAVFGKRHWSQSLAAIVRFIFSMLTALVWVSFLTELFKNLCGRLRPDYLSRCKPNVANFGNVTLQYGQSPVVTCTTDDMVGLHDGQQ